MKSVKLKVDSRPRTMRMWQSLLLPYGSTAPIVKELHDRIWGMITVVARHAYSELLRQERLK